MGPSSYMRSVVDRNVTMWPIPVTVLHHFNLYISVNSGFVGFLTGKVVRANPRCWWSTDETCRREYRMYIRFLFASSWRLICTVSYKLRLGWWWRILQHAGLVTNMQLRDPLRPYVFATSCVIKHGNCCRFTVCSFAVRGKALSLWPADLSLSASALITREIVEVCDRVVDWKVLRACGWQQEPHELDKVLRQSY
jgi:hypothetical protein